MDRSRFEVPVDRLRWRCDPATLGFRTTEELPPLREFIGQDRAIRAIDFGLAVDRPGYNIFVTGLNGTGKASIIKAHLESLIKDRKAAGKVPYPSDWCYLYNFAAPDQPKIAKLPPGKGRIFKQRIGRLEEDVRLAIRRAFAGPEYGSMRKNITAEAQGMQQELFRRLDQAARKEGLTIDLSPAGVSVLPLAGNRPSTVEEYQNLDPQARLEIDRRRGGFLGQVEETMASVRQVERAAAERIALLDKQMVDRAISRPFEEVRQAYGIYPDLGPYLDRLKEYTAEEFRLFREDEPDAADGKEEGEGPRPRSDIPLLPFAVNCFVDNADAEGPPVVEEGNPTFANLFGRLDRRFSMGAFVTDHTMLKAGAFQRANGGYLILDIKTIFGQPAIWESLKRVIKGKSVRPEDPAEAQGAVVPQGIRPEPMPLDVKVVVTGDTGVYNYLSAYDDDFWETFKVKADFDYQIRRTPQNMQAYASFVAGATRRCDLLPFDAGAVAKVMEHSARMMADQNRLSARFGIITDLLIEADHWARGGREGGKVVEAEHVQRAVEERVFRSSLVEERVRDMIADGTIMVSVEGEAVGQLNGLAVLNIGDFAFGRPSRITARTFLGRGGIINIERESQLSGKTHDKGILILSGYLAWKYAQDQPLSASASVTFEQSYGNIDGDSASSTEVYAILSSLAGVPLQQGIAVTGSVNQKGEVQAIGGVNEKIEGFFDLCRVSGLTGDQGVMVPRQNIKNLMLRDDIVQAAAEGKFHIYAVGSVDEGIELLTGMPAGVRGDDGKYPEGSINALVHKQLHAYSDRSSNRRNGDNPEGKPAEAAKPADPAPPAPPPPPPDPVPPPDPAPTPDPPPTPEGGS